MFDNVTLSKGNFASGYLAAIKDAVETPVDVFLVQIHGEK